MARMLIGNVKGPAGIGVPAGGSTGQMLKKASATDYDTSWGTLYASAIPMTSSDSTKVDAAITSANQAIGKQQEAIAIVSTGNTHAAIASEQYVYVREHSTLAEGLYKNKSGSAIAANVALSSSNVAAISNGGLNALSCLDLIFSGSANNDDGTVTYNLTHPYTDYKFIIIIVKTNYEKIYQVVPTETIANWDYVHFFGGASSTTGLISSYPYMASLHVKFGTTSSYTITRTYTNENWAYRVVAIYGFMK